MSLNDQKAVIYRSHNVWLLSTLAMFAWIRLEQEGHIDNCKRRIICKAFHLYKLLSTLLARRITAAPDVPATNTFEVPDAPAGVLARLAIKRRPDRRVWGIVSVPFTPATGTSQLHTGRLSFPFLPVGSLPPSQLHNRSLLFLLLFLFLQVESFPQPKFQRISTVGAGSARNISDVFFHELHRFWVFGVRHKKIAFHFHDFIMTS